MSNEKDIETLKHHFFDHGWQVKWEETRPVRQSMSVSAEDLGLQSATIKSLEKYKNSIYRHQYEAISCFLSGANIAVTTPTASGKTLIFNTCAIDILSRDPKARIIAIYPLKALASEQETRWRGVLKDAQIDAKVGRIDGDVQVESRLKLIKECRVLVLTPDIIHAWLFLNIGSPIVRDLLQSLVLLILDEAHTYSGVFGSNAAFLFRRIIHAVNKLGGNPRFIASSATMNDPKGHLRELVGEEFDVIGPELDASPQCELHTIFVDPPKSVDLLSAVSDLIHFTTTNTERQSITFVDSRKQTEYLATMLNRKLGQDDDNEHKLDFSGLQDLQIYPYRSGYEAEDRRIIQSRLASGKLRGVVSTSALEMGIDLPFLTMGIIYGIPRSATSYLQRVGRVGRRENGIVIVINNGSVMSESVFQRPERIRDLPLVQSALYLHNPRIQYIHAMCLARHGGEDEVVCAAMGLPSEPFISPVDVPDDFDGLCRAERLGELSPEFQTMKSQAGDDPYHTFPLRDLDMQFKVEIKQGPNKTSLGSLSFGQVMREAYPGAVYYYQTRAYRIVRIRKPQKTIDVRAEKRYFTSPKMLPVIILPNLTQDNIYQDLRFGELRVIECAMQINEAVVGFREHRGANIMDVEYPLNSDLGLYFDLPKFSRYVFTSGVIFDHPSLSKPQVKVDAISRVIYEAFLMIVPFEPQDINAGSDKHRSSREGIEEGMRFACVYDQTYGSLRLTSKLVDAEVLRKVFRMAVDISEASETFELNADSLAALKDVARDAESEPKKVEITNSIMTNSKYVEIIKEGSYGLNTTKDNEEFLVEAIFFSPLFGELAYRGKHVIQKKKAESENRYHSATSVIVPAKSIQQLVGLSQLAYYDYETGEVLETIPVA